MSHTPRSVSPAGPSSGGSRRTSPSSRTPAREYGAARAPMAGLAAAGGAALAPTPSPRAAAKPHAVDPFLQQSQEIRLTERDRQEGYDVDLLNAKPRTGGTKHAQPPQHHPARVPIVPTAAATGAGAAGINGSYASGFGRTTDGTTTSNPDSNGTASHHEKGAFFGPGDNKRYHRPWYMRKLAILAIVLLVAAAALAIGLGVGLSERKHDRKNESVQEGSSSRGQSGSGTGAGASAANGDSSRNATQTYNTSSRTKGTVIPSSLYSQYTDTVNNDTGWTSQITDATPTLSPSPTPSPIVTGSLSNTFEGTTRATTGNLPIPADSATTVGTVVYSSISALGGLQRRTMPTGRMVLARRRVDLPRV
ncbi:hypothetical protein OIV83_003768 [Microbotryomycetes sp. JL201]|nr:hypothetical protein OIV83_003768 [Microbotryomycetes sp. JL201]